MNKEDFASFLAYQDLLMEKALLEVAIKKPISHSAAGGRTRTLPPRNGGRVNKKTSKRRVLLRNLRTERASELELSGGRTKQKARERSGRSEVDSENSQSVRDSVEETRSEGRVETKGWEVVPAETSATGSTDGNPVSDPTLSLAVGGG